MVRKIREGREKSGRVKTTSPKGLAVHSEPVWKFLFSACGAGVSIKPGVLAPGNGR
jgi:hypothetical protein